jgi:hypothetical protein
LIFSKIYDIIYIEKKKERNKLWLSIMNAQPVTVVVLIGAGSDTNARWNLLRAMVQKGSVTSTMRLMVTRRKKMTEQTKMDLLDLLADLGKICDAASEGNVEVWYDAEGKVVETAPYSMTDNAFMDVCGAWQTLRSILVKNDVQVP